jgi:hypothetical protein
MSHTPSCRRAHAVGAGSRHFVTALVAVALCALLVPAAATAKVDAKYKVRYKNGVNGLAHIWHVDEETYNAYVEDLAETGQSIVDTLAGQPVDQAALDNERAHAAQMVKDAAVFLHQPENLEAGADFFYAHSKGWFSISADQIRFGRGTHNISAGAALIGTAWKHARDAFAQLALDPPDLAKAREYNQLAADAGDRANPKLSNGFAILRALQR